MIELAPAKINLCLHVTGQRADGYHFLDSLVVFAGVGDRIAVQNAESLSLRVTGPRKTEVSAGEDNLVLRAARLFSHSSGAAITLDKQLPVASGIGGGSADAAATLRVLARLWGRNLPDSAAVVGLGADVAACLDGRPLRMQGIGERLVPLRHLPDAWLVLVNPGVAVSTAEVFRNLANKANAALPEVPVFANATEMANWLATQRNDLEPAALVLAPEIAVVKRSLAAQPGCLLARMSGSGATCFGLFASEASARAGGDALRSQQGGWWVETGKMLG